MRIRVYIPCTRTRAAYTVGNTGSNSSSRRSPIIHPNRWRRIIKPRHLLSVSIIRPSLTTKLEKNEGLEKNAARRALLRDAPTFLQASWSSSRGPKRRERSFVATLFTTTVSSRRIEIVTRTWIATRVIARAMPSSYLSGMHLSLFLSLFISLSLSLSIYLGRRYISLYEVMTVMTLTTVWHLALGTRAFEWQRPQQLLPFTTAVRALLLPSPSSLPMILLLFYLFSSSLSFSHSISFSFLRADSIASSLYASSLSVLSLSLIISRSVFLSPSLFFFLFPFFLSLSTILLVSPSRFPCLVLARTSLLSFFPLLASGPSLPLVGPLSILRAIDRIPERNDEAKIYVYAFACAPFAVATLPSCCCSCEAARSIAVLLKSHNFTIFLICFALLFHNARLPVDRWQCSCSFGANERASVSARPLIYKQIMQSMCYNTRGSNRNTALHNTNLVLSGDRAPLELQNVTRAR